MQRKTNTDFIYLLRFIAAMWVVVKHYSPVRNVFINNGGEAVNFFYLLSGFILVIAYEKQIAQNGLSAVEFYVKRLARIYPLYIFALILSLSYLFLVENIYSNVPKKLPFEILMIQTWLYPGSINYPAWSISCEWFFYLLFPFYILKFEKLGLQKALIIAIVLVLASVFINYLAQSISTPFLRQDIKEGYFQQHPLFRFPIFLLGNVLGFMSIKNVKTPQMTFIFLLILGCALVGLWTLFPLKEGMTLKQMGFICFFISLLLFLLQSENFSKKYLSGSFFILLGDISFGIYLLQNPVFLYITHYTVQRTPYGEGGNAMLQFLVGVGVLLIVSYFTFIYLEKPLRSKIVNLYKSSFSLISEQTTRT